MMDVLNRMIKKQSDMIIRVRNELNAVKEIHISNRNLIVYLYMYVKQMMCTKKYVKKIKVI